MPITNPIISAEESLAEIADDTGGIQPPDGEALLDALESEPGDPDPPAPTVPTLTEVAQTALARSAEAVVAASEEKPAPKKRGRKPRAMNDDYPTPAPFARGMCVVLRDIVGVKPRVIIEPSAGDGTFIEIAKQTWPQAFLAASEIRAPCDTKLREAGANAVMIGDWIENAKGLLQYRQASPNAMPGPWLILGNPPFLAAQAHIEAGMALLAPGEYLAFLLRINFFGSIERRGFWSKPTDRLRYLFPFTERPKFTTNKDGKVGTDQAEYALFVWQKGYGGSAEIPCAIEKVVG